MAGGLEPPGPRRSWGRSGLDLLRRLGFPVSLGVAALLFILSLGVSMSRVSQQYAAEARMRRTGIWITTQAQVELTRTTAVVQRFALGAPGLDRATVELQFEILLSRLELLKVGEGPAEFVELARLRDRQDEIQALADPLEPLLQQVLLRRDASATNEMVRLLEAIDALMAESNLRLHLEQQADAGEVHGGLRSLHWTLVVCMAGLILSAGLLILLLAHRSRLARLARLRAEAAAQCQRDAERTLRVLIDSLPAMVSAYDRQGRYLFYNEAHARFHGLAEEEAVIGRSPFELGLSPDAGLRRALRGHAPEPFTEYATTGPEGSTHTLLATAAPVDDGRGGAGRVVHVALDITDRKEVENRVRHLAEHDSLTNLPNRLLFAARLRQALATARQLSGRCGFALHLVDLDRFKEVNDSLGHHGGDRLLLAAAERMRGCLRRGDTLARLGGDEFAVIQLGVTRQAEAMRLAARLVAVLARPFVVDGCTLHSGGSIGSVLGPQQGENADALQQRADIALYRAKAEGRGRAVLFSPEMEATLVERRALEADLRVALAEGALTLAYQPKFPVGDSHRPKGCEALLRWHHPTRGMVSPAQFVAVAEEAGLAAELSRFVLKTACGQIRAWQAMGLEMPVAVNLSAVHFGSDQAVVLVEEALRASGVPPRLLEVEVTEGVFIRNAATARAALAALRACGVRVALDDFGTGYSSLSYLQHLPFDIVKVDRAFVAELRDEAGSGGQIVDAIVRLVHGLRAEVVAEGVEEPAQLALLARLGCDTVQGYLLGRPMSPEAFAALYAPAEGHSDAATVAAAALHSALQGSRGLDTNLTRP